MSGGRQARLAALGRELRELLSRGQEEAAATAHAMAPEGTGAGWRVKIYGEDLDAPPRERRFQEVWPEWPGFLSALGDGDAAAVEAGLEVCSRLDGPGAQRLVPMAIALPPWSGLWKGISEVLARGEDEGAFRSLLAHAREPNASFAIGRSRFADGGPIALAELQRLGVPEVALEPRSGLIAQALIGYLTRVRYEPAWPLIAATARAASGLALYACLSLLKWNDARGLDVVESLIDRRGLERIATVAHLQRDAATAIDRLGGMEHLSSTAGKARAKTLLDAVIRDVSDARRERREARWIRADPRFIEVARRWSKDHETKELWKWLVGLEPELTGGRTASGPVRARGKSSARGTTKSPPSVPEADPALVGRVDAIGAALGSLVAALRERGYRFLRPRRARVAPSATSRRAVMRLEKSFGPLPAAVRLFWERVGSIDLRGTDPSWPRGGHVEHLAKGSREDPVLADPIVVLGPAESWDAIDEESRDDIAEGRELLLPLGLDDVTKAGQSGGPAWGVILPTDAPDPPLAEAGVDGTFLGYLETMIAKGGFARPPSLTGGGGGGRGGRRSTSR